MIDITKQYTYNGKPVRIYADGSDTSAEYIHGAFLTEAGSWSLGSFIKSDLIEVWSPKEGEVIWCWNDGDLLPSLNRYNRCTSFDWDTIMKFTGELPEAFKGL